MTNSLLEFEIDGAQIRLRPIEDGQYRRLFDRSNFIADDGMFYLRFGHCLRSAGLELQLGQIYVALRGLFGVGSATYDDYKCSFSYLFLLGAHKGGQTYHYTLDVGDLKGGMDWRFRRVQQKGDLRPRTHTADPLEDGLSREQLNAIIPWLYGNIRGYFKTIWTESQAPFYRFVPAVLLIYGLKDGQFFEQEFESEKKYKAEQKRLAEEIREGPDAIDELLETV